MISLKEFSITIIFQILIIDIINLYLRYKGYNIIFLIFIGPGLPIFYNYHSFKGKIYEYLRGKYPDILYEYRILSKITSWEPKIFKISYKTKIEDFIVARHKLIYMNLFVIIYILNFFFYGKLIDVLNF